MKKKKFHLHRVFRWKFAISLRNFDDAGSDHSKKKKEKKKEKKKKRKKNVAGISQKWSGNDKMSLYFDKKCQKISKIVRNFQNL